MIDVVGQRFICAVAQRPFEIESNGVFHHFCALLPLFDANGFPVNPEDFPDNGDVWWMLRPGTRGLAEPGRLVTAVMEDSIKAGTRGLAQFQANVDAVSALHSREYLEIIDVAGHMIREPRDLIKDGFRLSLDHSPLDTVCIRWRDVLLGRFRTSAEESTETSGRWEVRLLPESTDHTVFRIPREILARVRPQDRLETIAEVSLEKRPRHESNQLNRIRYCLVDSDALMRELPADGEQIFMKSDRVIIQQFARTFFTRGKKQQLMKLLDELDDLVTQSAEPLERVNEDVLGSLRKALAADVKASAELAEALISSGLLDERLRTAIAEREEKHIIDQAARLQAEVNKKLGDLHSELETLQREKHTMQTVLQQLKSRKLRELEIKLEKERSEFEQTLRRQEEEAKTRLDSIKRQEKVLAENLSKVAQSLVTNREDIINQLLTLAPILQQFGLFGVANPKEELNALGDRGPASLAAKVSASFPETPEDAGFQLPVFAHEGDLPSIRETTFFDRFKDYTKARGYRYRELDLLSFHVSVKCGDLTILGGQPGTGKSSLPRLYNDAIKGDNRSCVPDRYLHIAVGPSWLDSRDLLGHLNAISRTFQPADSSLFETLIIAQEEYRELGEDSGLYFFCLDEMNLSHVEHYFGGFLQVFELPPSQRELRIFSKDAVLPKCEFRRWATLRMPQSVRFVGTVNFDETTKQLSQRLLDRVNVIRLPADQLPLELQESTEVTSTGPEVRLNQYEKWVRHSAGYNSEFGRLLDDLRDDLRILNCSMNPRRFSAIRKFLASWPEEIAPLEKAIDLQISQRVLPQIRGLFQSGATDAIQRIQRKLKSHAFDFDESLRVLDSIYRTESLDVGYTAEGEA